MRGMRGRWMRLWGWILSCAFLLSACTPVFDQPLTLDQTDSKVEDLVGLWKVEIDDALLVAAISRKSENQVSVNVLAHDKLLRFDASLGKLDSQNMTIIDLSTFKGYSFDSEDIASPFTDQRLFVIAYVDFLQEGISVFSVNKDKINRDIGSELLAGSVDVDCNPPETPEKEFRSEDAGSGRAFLFCLFKVDEDFDLSKYFLRRGRILIDEDESARLTKLL